MMLHEPLTCKPAPRCGEHKILHLSKTAVKSQSLSTQNKECSYCALPELPFPTLAYFHFEKLLLSNCPSDAGRASVSVYSRSARARNVICATVGKRIGCGFNYGGYGRVRVCKIRAVQDSDANCSKNESES